MKQIRIVTTQHPRYSHEVIAPARLFGKRIRKSFTSRDAARVEKQKLENKLAKAELAPLERDVHLIAARYQKRLTVEQMDKALLEAAEHYDSLDTSLEDLGNRYKAQQEASFKRGACGDDHIRDVRCRTPKVVKWLGNPQARDVTEKMLEEFVEMRLEDEAAPRTIKNYLTLLSAVMKLGIKEGSVAVNPVVDFKMPKGKGKVHIMKPEQLTKLLAHATDLTMPLIMFGAFGGLRTSEIKRLKWSDIRLEEDQLYVPPHKGTGEGKTSNAERWIQLTPPLRVYCEAMLKQRSRGLVLSGRCDVTLTRHRRQMYKAAGLRIPHNALRHSYGSHHLVHYDNPANTATEMGHYSPQQTFAAYRRAVNKSQAAKFWNVHKVCDLSKAGGTLGNGATTGGPTPRKNKAH